MTRRQWIEPLVITDQTIDRFWNLVEIKGPDECWPPKGAQRSRERNVYAQFTLGLRDGKNYRVTFARMALMITLGREIEHGKEVCHACHWKPCANPAHLFEGTPTENRMSSPDDVRSRINAIRTEESYEGFRRGGAWHKGRKKPPGHGEKQRTAQHTSRMRECSCGMKTNAGSMARHRNATGHELKCQD